MSSIPQGLSFAVKDHRVQKIPDSQKKVYSFNVDFGGGKTASFHLQVRTMRAALAVIESFGQQVKDMDQGQFNDFKAKMKKKPFAIDHDENVEEVQQRKFFGILPNGTQRTVYDDVAIKKPHRLADESYKKFDYLFHTSEAGKKKYIRDSSGQPVIDPATTQPKPLGVSQSIRLDQETLALIDAYARGLEENDRRTHPASVELRVVPKDTSARTASVDLHLGEKKVELEPLFPESFDGSFDHLDEEKDYFPRLPVRREDSISTDTPLFEDLFDIRAPERKSSSVTEGLSDEEFSRQMGEMRNAERKKAELIAEEERKKTEGEGQRRCDVFQAEVDTALSQSDEHTDPFDGLMDFARPWLTNL